MTCTASPGFIERNRHQLPRETGSVYTEEGLRAHELAAACVLLGFDPMLFGSDIEMAGHVKGYVEIAEHWAQLPGAMIQVEMQVPLFYNPDTTGTLDLGVATTDNRVFIGDLKYGAGVPVAAKGNTQLGIYAISFIRMLEKTGLYEFNDDTLVTIMVYQPRVLGESARKLWCISLAELKLFCEGIQAVAQSIHANPHGGVFAPSDSTCQFCHASPLCSARAGHLLGGMDVGAEEVVLHQPPSKRQLPPVNELTVEQLSRIVALAPSVKEWLGECEKAGLGLLLDGKRLPGFKLVAGRSNRVWKDEDQALELCLEAGLAHVDVVEPQVLKSPPQLENVLKLHPEIASALRSMLSSLITKPLGKPTLVSLNDPRPALASSPADFFDNLDEGASLLS